MHFWCVWTRRPFVKQKHNTLKNIVLLARKHFEARFWARNMHAIPMYPSRTLLSCSAFSKSTTRTRLFRLEIHYFEQLLSTKQQKMIANQFYLQLWRGKAPRAFMVNIAKLFHNVKYHAIFVHVPWGIANSKVLDFAKLRHGFRLWERFTNADTVSEGLMWERANTFVKLIKPRKPRHRSTFNVVKLLAGGLLPSAFGLKVHCSNFRFANENAWFEVLHTKTHTVEITHTRAVSLTQVSEFLKQNIQNNIFKSTCSRVFSEFWSCDVWKTCKTRAGWYWNRENYFFQELFCEAFG